MTVLQTFVGGFKVAKPLTGITLDKTSVTLKIGESVDFTVTPAPSDASNKRYQVTSSNTGLLTVARKSGNTWTATAAANPSVGGNATINVVSATNPNVKVTLTVAVRIPVTAVTVDKTTISGDTKTTTDIVYTVLPANATDLSLIVTSSDTKLATVAKKATTGNKHTYTVTYVKGGEGTIKAVSVSDPTVTVSTAFTAIQTGPSDEEKAAWTAARQKEMSAGTYKGKVPAENFQPLEGWFPFEGMGSTPAEIISACAKANDFSALFIGDYMDITVSNNSMRYEIASFDQYLSPTNTKHHALMVPTKCWPTKMAFATSGTADYKNSSLHSWEQGTFYNALPATTRSSILEVTIPWWNYNNQRQDLKCKVFSLSNFEVGNNKGYSGESQIAKGSKEPNHHLSVLFKNQSDRVRQVGSENAYWWLRSADSGYSGIACLVYTGGALDHIDASWSGGAAVPCFTLG